MPAMICASSIQNPKKNVLVIAEKINDDKLPRGKIIHYFGECGDIDAEHSAIHYAYTPNYWTAFPSIVEPVLSNKYILDVDTVNIDPEGCQDIDDCISFWDHHVAITIADVAEWINVNPWMKHAAKIGQTLYVDGTPVRKLFPHEYSMSLIPNERRHGIALIFDFIAGVITNIRFEYVIVINKQSYTYETCKDWKYSTRLQKVAESIAGHSLEDPHKWIEHLMIFYNRQCASCIAASGRGLLRGHDSPLTEKVEQYTKIGLPTHLAYSSALYYPASEHVEHWGIGGTYCHATSPIRRYADCINQMALKGMEIEECHAELNTLQRYAKKHTRDITFLRVIHDNKSLSGIVVGPRRIWCLELNCMITCETEISPGTRVNLSYFYDPNKPTWKTRLVFRVSDMNCTSSLLPEK
jgi:exoribonuclease R